MIQNNSTFKIAIEQLKQGGMIILVDDHDRENEGDIVLAGEFATNETINFMIKKAGGIVCLSVESVLLKKFNIGVQPMNHASSLAANFSVSVDAVHDITTGVSAADRVKTIQTLLDENATSDDIATPGHLFPLCAKPKGVLERRGHTEGSVDLMKIAGLKPAAVICEIIGEEGAMLRGDALKKFAQEHQLPFISIQDIVNYRLSHENWVSVYSQANISTKQYGKLSLTIFKDELNNQEIPVITPLDFHTQASPFVRLHSSCFTGDILGSQHCDCGEQLSLSLQQVVAHKGVLIYLPQEGRNIGLGNKIKAYALQQQGMDTVEANHALGFEDDERNYAIAAHILKQLNIDSVKLLTNNPRKVAGLECYGITVTERIPLEIKAHADNQQYLHTKKHKLKHLLSEIV
jgi:3,4-dihydroxy 2-butanone 4-phosphate synthase/GTP cyclohydrolase II